jgi:hypothetical protein
MLLICPKRAKTMLKRQRRCLKGNQLLNIYLCCPKMGLQFKFMSQVSAAMAFATYLRQLRKKLTSNLC